jgi:arginine decarboxylase
MPESAATSSAESAAPASPATWSPQQSSSLYGVPEWGNGYFSVNEQGHVVAHPTRDPSKGVDIKKIVDELVQRDVPVPLLLRFDDILADRVKEIAGSFQKAITDHNYKGRYRCVYPIKVNQQRQIVEKLLEHGKKFGFGIEAGSKPELLAVMALVDDDDTPIICNGFKDAEFIEAVILARKIGRNIIPVVEKFSELELIVHYAKLHDVKPSIGVRVKLAARGAGRWEGSGGVRSKFGLFVHEVVEALDYLRAAGMAECMDLLHFHLGSQINHIRNVKNAIIELSRVYVELQRMGADLHYIDVGGGLGVDYDGSQTTAESSINYSLQEYANDIIYHVGQVCDQAEVPHPTIISESGRALVAYHSLLIFNVVGTSGFDGFHLPTSLSKAEREELPAPVVSLFDTFQNLNEDNYSESYNDALLARDETLHLFNLGYSTLAQRSLADRLYLALCKRVLAMVQKDENVSADFDGLESLLADTYFCNFSIFQSMPDSWAIDQLFPIMPIHRLEEKPTQQGILADITCDSDGKVDHFISGDARDPNRVLPLHKFTGQDYYMGVFLVGAYQEILGDLHNLFGDTNAVHISMDEDGEPFIEEVIEGDTVREVLHYVQFSADDLQRAMRRMVERALRRKVLTVDESRKLLSFYETGLEGYTYLE